jgi:hypothetical protein
MEGRLLDASYGFDDKVEVIQAELHVVIAIRIL